MSKKQDLYRLIEAMRIVAPYCLYPRFKTDQHVCGQASAGAVEALKAFGVDARPIAVACIAGFYEPGPDQTDQLITAGHNPRSLFEKVSNPSWGDYDTWIEQCTVHLTAADRASDETKAWPFHIAVRATHGSGSAFIDLTIGQLNNNPYGIQLPSCIYNTRQHWPNIVFDNGCFVEYDPSPYPERVPPIAFTYRGRGLANDLRDTMELALANDLRGDITRAKLDRMLPAVLAAADAELHHETPAAEPRGS